MNLNNIEPRAEVSKQTQDLLTFVNLCDVSCADVSNTTGECAK